MNQIIIPLNSYSQSELTLDEHETLFHVIKDSGAYGVELRRELFAHQGFSLEAIRKSLESLSLFTVFSAPVVLWKEDGSFNEEIMQKVFWEAEQVNAKWLKVSLGHFRKDFSDLIRLKKFIKPHTIQLLVENDQTLCGGQINSLNAFFNQVALNDLNIKMTFDIGNWLYTDQDPEEALNIFAPHVMYLHLKQVVVKNNTCTTIPLSFENRPSWIQFVKAFPNTLVKALEFPIKPAQKTKDYIEQIFKRKEEFAWNQ